jgi:cytochrome c-type biogenesis protein CcmH
VNSRTSALFNQRWAMLIGLLLVLLLASMSTARAQQDNQPVTDDQVNAVAKELYCPVCENIPLDACGTAACQQWRDLIREKLSQGWSDEQIKVYFAEQYGDRVLAEPPRSGLNWLAYLVPPLAFLLGVFILVKAFTSWKSSGPAGAAAPAAPPEPDQASASEDEYIARLEEELRRSN